MDDLERNLGWDQSQQNTSGEFNIRRLGRFDFSVYYESDGNGKLKCRFPGCNIKLSGNYSSNLFRHLKQRHPEIYEPARNARLKRKSIEQTTQLADKLKPPQIRFSKDTILRGCAELVTTNGQPFSLLQKSGFRYIIDPIINAFAEEGILIDVSENGIRNYINSQSGFGALLGPQNTSESLDVLDDSQSRDSDNGSIGRFVRADGLVGPHGIHVAMTNDQNSIYNSAPSIKSEPEEVVIDGSSEDDQVFNETNVKAASYTSEKTLQTNMATDQIAKRYRSDHNKLSVKDDLNRLMQRINDIDDPTANFFETMKITAKRLPTTLQIKSKRLISNVMWDLEDEALHISETVAGLSN